MICIHQFESPIGTMRLAWKSGKNCASHILFSRDSLNDVNPSQLHRIEKPNLLPSVIKDLLHNLENYFKGCETNFSLDYLDLKHVTGFRERVYKRVFSIPKGQTLSYSDVAAEVHSPKAARAVGQIMAANPFPIIIPCHRVISKSGQLCGFRGGLDVKRFLLDFEQQH